MREHWCTVDASGAGEGQLIVDVSLAGKNVPSHVIPGQAGRYHVSFVPDSPGTHQIRVYFAGVEIGGTVIQQCSSGARAFRISAPRNVEQLAALCSRKLSTSPTGGVHSLPPQKKIFFSRYPQHCPTGDVRSSYTYTDRIYDILSYRRLLQ